MRRALRTRARKKVKIKTPGGKSVIHIKAKRPSYHICASCKAKLNRARLLPVEVKRIPKVRRRPERPLPNLCPKCMKEHFKKKIRG